MKTIKFVTVPTADKNGNMYMMIYTPDRWAKNADGSITKIAGEQHFCYDEAIFEHLVVGATLNIQ
jgi:hypothetical protein